MTPKKDEHLLHVARTSPFLVFYLYCTNNSQLKFVQPEEANKFLEHYNVYKNIQLAYGSGGFVASGLAASQLLPTTGFKKLCLTAVFAFGGYQLGKVLTTFSEQNNTATFEMKNIIFKYDELFTSPQKLSMLYNKPSDEVS